MFRLLILLFAALLIFLGFSLLFLIEGVYGTILAPILVISGAALFWISELKTKSSLDADTPLNKILKSDGDDLIER